MELLTHRPDSHYRAAALGGQQFFGWDDDRYLLADTRDILMAIGAGLGGEKPDPSDFYTRPVRDEQPDDGGTVAEFDVAGFLRRLAGA